MKRMWWMEVVKRIGAFVPVIAFIVWLRYSMKVVGPNETAVLILFGDPKRVCDSGWVFNLQFPLPSCYLVKFPKKIYNLDYSARAVISKEGKYPDTEEGKEYAVQVLMVDSAGYINFPTKKEEDDEVHPLITILKSGVPIEDEELKDWTEEAVIAALRATIGSMTWREAIENIEGVRDRAEAVFRDKDGALLRAGFKQENLKLAIEEIKLPRRLEEALPKVDIERLEAGAAKFEAEQIAMETVGAVIHMMAESRGLSPEEIQEKINKSTRMQKEFRELSKDLIIREMGIKGGAYVDIRVQGAEGLERMLLNTLAVWQKTPPKKSPEEKESQTREEKIKAAIRERKGW